MRGFKRKLIWFAVQPSAFCLCLFNKMKALRFLLFFLLLPWLAINSCNKNDDPPPGPDTGKLTIRFHHHCEGAPLETDIRKYVNEAGNEYMVNEIQYFISDVKLCRTDGSYYLISAWKDIHYVDTDIPSTHTWNVFDDIPAGAYQKLSFTFGISEEKNQSLMFVDPPESLMFWPQYLGGGYHYLKLNGKWLAANQMELPFDFHLGIGQIYDPQSGAVTGFIQNYFEIAVPVPGFIIAAGQEAGIDLVMHVENWFKDPHTYDHDEWGGDIMQKQETMKLGCENGWNVFGLPD
jgi:hypothetical protein